jgi:hypothetical protein
MIFRSFTSGFALALVLASTAFAQGGNDPVPGIDIIIKEAGIQAPIINIGFNPDQLKKLNSLKGFDRPAYMASVGAGIAQKTARGAPPKGGWEAAFKETLTKNWTVEERGGSTTVNVATQEQKYAITFTVRTEEDIDKEKPVRGADSGLLEQSTEGAPFAASSIGQELLDVPMGRMIRETAPAACVTEAGDVDANCNGVSDAAEGDGKPQPTKADTYGVTRSNRSSGSITESKPSDIKK